jgi:UV excision repair protein RAD23
MGSAQISEVKEKIAKEKGWEPSQQKLIYSGMFHTAATCVGLLLRVRRHNTFGVSLILLEGKILQDANTVESYKIEEKGFIVCMVTKVRLWWQRPVFNLNVEQPKAGPTTTASSSKGPSTPTQAVTATSTPPAAPSQLSSVTAPLPSTPTPASTEAPAATDSHFNDPSSLVIGDEGAAAIANIESMGFDRPQIEAAMRAAFFNPNRAVEYLINVCNSKFIFVRLLKAGY